jgi:uncharacterized protein YndB with AHSA1/START domain
MTPPSTAPSSAAIEADDRVPLIRITREFAAAPAAVMRAHTDPELFARWIGPSNLSTRIEHWDTRDGGSFRYVNVREDEEYTFRGCFHTVAADVIVQTFAWEGMPDQVALETLRLDDLGGRTRLVVESLCDSFEARDGWLSSGMETGVNEGYAALDGLLPTVDPS